MSASGTSCTTRSGQLLGIVVQREGGAEISVYDRRDPDRARGVFRLSAEEADAVAEVLGAPRLTQRFADLSKEVPGLQSAPASRSRPGSPFDGRSLGDTRARTLTGCSIVAIVRGRRRRPLAHPADQLPRRVTCWWPIGVERKAWSSSAGACSGQL